ncbi:hypothetical protein JAAARDRAFT_37053 [Jaapia argillacea MUCL 33604]|uniref:Uncharacterized protein n=1 Tax=Jaapia argillacea MUCL 33604 TaxID=933084 RepID=A0A067PLG5_9AGAM|nr:hypothetical protein JAAARDRAFT_37053 [Jaapia argillacea MUCL 33604]
MTSIEGFTYCTSPISNRVATSNRRNKHRLYLAFYHQGREYGDDTEFHSALVLAPKAPVAGRMDSWRFHVRNIGVGRGCDNWIYEGKQALNGDMRIVSMQLLCKLDDDRVSGMGLGMLLRDVDVAEDDPSWCSKHWVRSAIQMLVDKDVIPQLHMQSRTIWKNGFVFAKSVANRPSTCMPVCDTTGREIKSDIHWTPLRH